MPVTIKQGEWKKEGADKDLSSMTEQKAAVTLLQTPGPPNTPWLQTTASELRTYAHVFKSTEHTTIKRKAKHLPSQNYLLQQTAALNTP